MNKEIIAKKPILVLTDDRWSQGMNVVFDDDELIGNIILDEWVDQEMEQTGVEIDDAEDSLIGELFDQNSNVDRYWSDHMILRCGNRYIKYSDDGMCHDLDDDDVLAIIGENV